MVQNNDKSQTGPHLVLRTPVHPTIPISHFREQLEALRPKNENASRRQLDETNPPTRVEFSILILLELLQKEGKQL